MRKKTDNGDVDDAKEWTKQEEEEEKNINNKEFLFNEKKIESKLKVKHVIS